MKFSKNGMEGTLRAPAAMIDESKGAPLERLANASKAGSPLEKNWLRKKDVEMIEDQAEENLEADEGQPDCIEADYLDFDRAPKVPDKNWLKELIIQPIEVGARH